MGEDVEISERPNLEDVESSLGICSCKYTPLRFHKAVSLGRNSTKCLTKQFAPTAQRERLLWRTGGFHERAERHLLKESNELVEVQLRSTNFLYALSPSSCIALIV